MTETTNPTEQAVADEPELSGVDLARVALHQAREAAKKRGTQARAPRSRRGRVAQRDGREPSGFAAVLQDLMADRAWKLPAGGGVLERWPDIATAVAPQLTDHVAAVAFHRETGQLDLRPDSPAYATQLRLISSRIVTAANELAGTGAVRAVRAVRVLAVGTAPEPRTERPVPQAPSASATPQAPIPVKTRESASQGYRRALEAHQASRKATAVDPAIQGAVERQIREQAREPQELFDGHQAMALRNKSTGQQQARSSDAARARALHRLTAERAGLAPVAPAVTEPRRSDRTA